MNDWTKRPLRTLVNTTQRAKSPSGSPRVWNLNLDQIESHSGSVLEKVYTNISELGSSTYAFEPRTVLYSKLRPYLNKVVVADEAGFATTELVPLRCNPEEVLPEFLAYFLRSPDFLRFATTVVAGAKMPRMVMSEFWAYEVSLPPIPEQRRIAAILDQADALRVKRRAALEQLDSITQAIFVEQYGDPITNDKGIETTRLSNLCKRITDGTHQPPKWSPPGHPFLFVSNIVSGEINFSTKKYISEETHAELTRRCPIEVGDVLYSTVGSYGVPAVVRTSRKFSFQRHIAHLKPNPELLDSNFLWAMLSSAPLRRQADRIARGVAQKTLNLSDISQFLVFCPPVSIQREFSTQIKTVEAQKQIYRRSLAELDALFASLQHRAFRGEH